MTGERCSHRNYRNSFHGSPCRYKAKVTEDGKPYCTRHAPSYKHARKLARLAKSEAKWNAEKAAKIARHALLSRQPHECPACGLTHTPEGEK